MIAFNARRMLKVHLDLMIIVRVLENMVPRHILQNQRAY